MILRFSHDGQATCSAVQSIPDFQENAFAVLSPLMIPEPQLLNAFRCQKVLTLHVSLLLLRQAMLKTVQFNAQLCSGTEEIEKVFPSRMLAAEFKSGKTARAQVVPQLLFLIGLLAAQAAGVACGIHK